jgi:hypothetical protein
MSVFELHCPKTTRPACALAHSHISLQSVGLEMWLSAVSHWFVPTDKQEVQNESWFYRFANAGRG